MELQKEINSLQSSIIAHKTYLKETDYKAIKEAETGVAMLSEVKDERQFARDEINRLEYEVSMLEEQLKNKKEDEDEFTE